MFASSAVVAYVSVPQLSVLQQALVPTPVYKADTAQDLDRLLTIYPKAVAVVDPQDSIDQHVTLDWVFDTHPTVPVVAYMALSPLAVQATLSLAHRGMRHLMLRGFDDSPERIRDIVERATVDTLIDQFLKRIAPVVRPLPMTMQRAIQNLFYNPARIVWIDDLAHTAGFPRRTFQQYLERVGITPGGHLLRMARVLHIYYHLSQGQTLLKALALKLGYSNERALSREVQRVLGHAPSVAARRVSPEQAIELLAQQMMREPVDQVDTQVAPDGDMMRMDTYGLEGQLPN